MLDSKQCWMSLGLEKLSVGRNGLLPLRGISISPFPFILYLPRASMLDSKQCWMSLGLEKLSVGWNGLLPLRGISISPSTPMV